jgi:hypothetical protein
VNKPKKTYDLTEAEQRDLFNLIQQGKVPIHGGVPRIRG